jgi:hypothetical protein
LKLNIGVPLLLFRCGGVFILFVPVFYLYVSEMRNSIVQGVFNEFDAFTALRFTATGASPAAKRTRV